MTGVMALEEGGRVDFTRLRQQRRQSLFAAMDAAELDVLVLGRPANVRYASGARQLWRTGANPFAPMCIVVRQSWRAPEA
jgi:Xaa-Pro dipeptidase